MSGDKVRSVAELKKAIEAEVGGFPALRVKEYTKNDSFYNGVASGLQIANRLIDEFEASVRERLRTLEFWDKEPRVIPMSERCRIEELRRILGGEAGE